MRPGFTVLHLLICIIIVVLLACILIPAAENLRRAASRMSCRNNLKQFGLAIDQYHTTHQHFPVGTMPRPELPPEERLSFFVAIMPFVEGDPTYAKLDKTGRWDSPHNVGVMTHWLSPLHRCPEWMGRYGQQSGANFATGHRSVTNYIGVAGVGADAATRPAEALDIGFFGYDRTLKKDDLKDGPASTMLLIETGHELGPWIRGGTSTVRGLDLSVDPLQGDGAPFGGTHFFDKAFFRGTGTDGYHILLGDGSVRYVKGRFDLAILAALATVAGREGIPADW